VEQEAAKEDTQHQQEVVTTLVGEWLQAAHEWVCQQVNSQRRMHHLLLMQQGMLSAVHLLVQREQRQARELGMGSSVTWVEQKH
jgi:hypothetical protein